MSSATPNQEDRAASRAFSLASFGLGAAVAVAICVAALKVYDGIGGFESVVVLAIGIAAAAAMVWQGRWRAFGFGLLSLLLSFLLMGVALDGWSDSGPEPPSLGGPPQPPER